MVYPTLVSRDTLERHLQDPRWVIVDCRFNLADPAAGHAAYRESHLPNARYAHLDRDLSGPKSAITGRHPLPAPQTLAHRLGAWGIDNAKQVVAYDDAGGAMAARLWWLLRWLGHAAVGVLDGGINRWREEGRPLTAELPRIARADFSMKIDNDAWVDSDFIARNLADPQSVVLDARAAERFAGQVEPIDPVAGHIPAAVNRPFDRNLDARGEFLPSAMLRDSLRVSLPNTSPARVIHMCGSGVTACHNLLAMEIAGLAGSRLYAGSWSEWIMDPARPRASGDSGQ
ncbi:MAG: sulfurtransferase [Gammaproteobacteria bacterium]|nr:sulfurtransferase [Gammaproteobacteria bacterium]